MVFVRAHVAVFLDGCFWHGCPDHYVQPSTNADYWRMKIAANGERDRDTDVRLEQGGWCVVRVWEHEPVIDAAADIVRIVRARSMGSGPFVRQGSPEIA